MTFQYEQLLYLTVLAIMVYGAVKSNNLKVQIIVAVIILIAFIANPFRMTVPKMTQVHHDGATNFDNIPDKVVVESKPSFDEYNKEELNKFDKLYKETENEVHN